MNYAKTSVAALLLLAGCSSGPSKPDKPIPATAPGFIEGKKIHPKIKIGRPYQIRGRTYYPKYDPDYDETGMASWYGPNFHGKSTANGEEFNQWALTAAHKTLPLPSMVRVARTDNGQSIIVRINDRGPFAHGRIIDLSRAAAEKLGMMKSGVAQVRVTYLPEETEEYINSLNLKKPKQWKGAATVASAPKPVVEQRGLEPLPFETKPVAPVVAPPKSSGYVIPPFAVLEKPKAITPRPSALGVRGYYLQAGAFTKRDNALRFAGKLEAYGETEIVEIPLSDGSLWRVKLGPVASRAQAEILKTQLSQHGVNDAHIIDNR